MIAEKLKFNPQIEGLRAIAVIGVLIEHLLRPHINNPWLRDLPYGKGVLLFFVISGYLITYQIFFFKEKNKLNGISQWRSIFNFFMRRVLRIFPLYYALILVLLLINFTGIQDLWIWLITYNANLKMSIENVYLGNYTHLWSLAVEEKFYLIWVWIVVLIPPRRTIFGYMIIAIISIASLNILKYAFKYPMAADFLTISNFFIFIPGALVAYFQFYHAEKFKRLNWKLMGWIIVIYILLLFPLYNRELYNANLKLIYLCMKPLISVLFGLIVAFAAALHFKSIWNWILVNPVIQYIGKISYGIYALHFFMPPLWYELNHRFFHIGLNPKLEFLVVTTLTIFCATISWFLVEKPFLKWKKKFAE